MVVKKSVEDFLTKIICGMSISCHVCREKDKLFYSAQNGELVTTLHFSSSYVKIGLASMQTSLVCYVNVRTLNTE